ncbi:M56 family metallopeptidase [Actinomadura nitritigenes]|uniref:M56 family metallopeptidase n=1 Tax=Actinomadura nitritigenes TaxID=134602 RepID=A0ABS3RBV7_9ACTN|nr:M56 family metallopeptidase [Actinomadura nitritigenes]MBO2443718.1 M56 family metallopeptidase [Actinomadura nitritigenes]
MNVLTFLPLGLMAALSAVLGLARLPVHPVWTARLLATTGAMTAVAALGTGVFVAVNYGASLAPGAAAHLPEWALFGDDRPVPGAVGIPVTALTLAGLIAVSRAGARWTRELRAAGDDARRPLETPLPIAVAVPGRRGGVLVSRGLLRDLTSEELRVVFEHEGSHLRHRHHRYLAAGTVATSLLPFLRPLEARLRLAVERWADEDAAEAVGDRALVARTIARVALAHRPAPGPAAGFADSGVVQRVEALLGTPPAKNTVTGPLLLLGNGFVTSSLTAATLQLDHAVASVLLPLLATW